MTFYYRANPEICMNKLRNYRSVNFAYERYTSYCSDQGEVWNQASRIQALNDGKLVVKSEIQLLLWTYSALW